MVPQNVTSIDVSAFTGMRDPSISIESGSSTFVITQDVILDFDRKILIRYFGSAS
jgi:hypothetical protein